MRKRRVYSPERTADAIREKAKHAFGRRDEAEEDEPGAEVVPQRPVAAGDVRKEQPKPVRLDPMSMKPVGTKGFDASMGEHRIREVNLGRPMPMELVRDISDQHDLEEEAGLTYVALLRHCRGLNVKGVPSGWANVQTNEPSLLQMIGGDPKKLERGFRF